MYIHIYTHIYIYIFFFCTHLSPSSSLSLSIPSLSQSVSFSFSSVEAKTTSTTQSERMEPGYDAFILWLERRQDLELGYVYSEVPSLLPGFSWRALVGPFRKTKGRNSGSALEGKSPFSLVSGIWGLPAVLHRATLGFCSESVSRDFPSSVSNNSVFPVPVSHPTPSCPHVAANSQRGLP